MEFYDTIYKVPPNGVHVLVKTIDDAMYDGYYIACHNKYVKKYTTEPRWRIPELQEKTFPKEYVVAWSYY